MFEAGLVSLLKGNTALMATIEAGPMPVLVPEQTALPCLSYQIVGGGNRYTLDKTSQQTRAVQLDAWGASYSDCKNITLALRNLLDCYTGTLTDGTRVLSAFLTNEIDNWEFDGRSYRITVEYRFQIVEA